MYKKLLAALGIPDAPDSTAQKILKDNFFYNQCLAALVLDIAPSVADKLHPMEHAALLKRYAPDPVLEMNPGGVTWSVEKSRSGQWYILANGPAKDVGNGTTAYSGSARYTGRPANAHTFSFMGQRPPAEILTEYQNKWRPLDPAGPVSF